MKNYNYIQQQQHKLMWGLFPNLKSWNLFIFVTIVSSRANIFFIIRHVYIHIYIYYSLGWNLCSIYGVIYKLTRFFIFNTFVLFFSYIRFFITKIRLHFHDKKNPYLYLYWKNNSYTTDLDFIVVIALLLMNINVDRFTIICNYFGNQTMK